jgi:hypothetical protein
MLSQPKSTFKCNSNALTNSAWASIFVSELFRGCWIKESGEGFPSVTVRKGKETSWFVGRFDLKLESLGHVNNSLGKPFHVKDHIWKQEKRKERIKEKSTNQPVYSLMRKKSRVLFFLSDTCFMLNEDGEYLLEFFY